MSKDLTFGVGREGNTSRPAASKPLPISTSCIEVRLNISAGKVKKGTSTKANGWRHVAYTPSGPVAFHEDSGKALVSFTLFNDGGNQTMPVWAFEPKIRINKEVKEEFGSEVNNLSTEQLLRVGAASIVGWEMIPLNWEGLSGLQTKLVGGTPGVNAKFTVELKGSVVTKLQAAEWSKVSLALTLDLDGAIAGKSEQYMDRFYRSISAKLINAEVMPTLPMGDPIKGISEALKRAKEVSLAFDGEEEDEDAILLRESVYLKVFANGEKRKKSKVWKDHVPFLSSENPQVKALAVHCLGQLLQVNALKEGNAQHLSAQYGVEIVEVSGPPVVNTPSNADDAGDKPAEAPEEINFSDCLTED